MAQNFEILGDIIDHLVDAMGDPSATLRRVWIYVDIDQHDGTTQHEILKRLNITKSRLNRHIDWLHDHGHILKKTGLDDAREIHLYSVGVSQQYLQQALNLVDHSHHKLKNLLEYFIKGFGANFRPTLRETKIALTVGINRKVSKSDLLDELYNGPYSTDVRAIKNLEDIGLIEKNDEL